MLSSLIWLLCYYFKHLDAEIYPFFIKVVAPIIIAETIIEFLLMIKGGRK